MLSFSICMIVRNEFANLKRLFETELKLYFDLGGKVVVYDTGSTDNTVSYSKTIPNCVVIEAGTKHLEVLTREQIIQIRRQWFSTFSNEIEEQTLMKEILKEGDKVFHFGEARNYAHRNSPTPMVFALDASETFLAFDVLWCEQQIRNGKKRFAYIQEYVTSHNTTNQEIARFYDSSVDHWEGRIHEILTDYAQVAQNNLQVKATREQLCIRHLYNEGKSRRYYDEGMFLDLLWFHQKKKNNGNKNAAAKGTNNKPKKKAITATEKTVVTGASFEVYSKTPFVYFGPERWYYYLSRSMAYCNVPHLTAQILELYVQSNNTWHLERVNAYLTLADCYNCIGEEKKMVHCLYEAVKTDPGMQQRTPFFKLIDYYRAKNWLQAAACFIKAAAEIPVGQSVLGTDIEHDSSKLDWDAYFVYYGLNRPFDAKSSWIQQALRKPHDVNVISDRCWFIPASMPF